MWESQLFPGNIVGVGREERLLQYKLVLLLRLREERKKVKSQLQVPGHPNRYKQGVKEDS